VSYRFGAEIFLAYGTDEQAISDYMAGLLDSHKQGMTADASYTTADGYPLPSEFGEIGKYTAALFEDWRPMLTTGIGAPGAYFPDSMTGLPYAEMTAASLSAKLLVVKIGTGNEMQLMKELLSQNLSVATDVMCHNGYLFMLVSTAGVTPADLAAALGVSWTHTVGDLDLLPAKLSGYYDTIAGDSNYTGLDNNANSIWFANTEMAITIIHFDSAASAGIYFTGLAPDGQYITRYDDSVFIFTPEIDGIVNETQIAGLKTALGISGAWSEEKNASNVGFMSSAELAIYTAVSGIGYYQTPTDYGQAGGAKYHAVFVPYPAVTAYGLQHTMEFYVYDSKATAASQMSVLFAGDGVSAVYMKDNIILVYKNVVGGDINNGTGTITLLPADALQAMVVDGMQDAQLGSVKGMQETVCGTGGEWDGSETNI
jgi:hypothetical protein